MAFMSIEMHKKINPNYSKAQIIPNQVQILNAKIFNFGIWF